MVAVAAVVALVAALLLLDGRAGHPARPSTAVAAGPARSGATAPSSPIGPSRTGPAGPAGQARPAAADRAAAPVARAHRGRPAGPPGVLVLNDSRITGLAAASAGRLRAAGWPVLGIGNLPGDVPRTTVYYALGLRAPAAALARRFAGIRAVAPRPSWLPRAPLVLVMTRLYPL